MQLRVHYALVGVRCTAVVEGSQDGCGAWFGWETWSEDLEKQAVVLHRCEEVVERDAAVEVLV